MATFKVIIAGSRTFNSYETLREACDHLLQNKADITIVSGTARGADQLGERYAGMRGYKLIKMPAEWDKEGKSAGYKRNERMADVADGLIAFHDGESRGTAHMIRCMETRNKPFKIIKF